MNLDVLDLLRRYGLRPDKGLGQNFLMDASALERIIQAAEIHCDDLVLEIGPGLGSLTRLLAAQSRKVVAVELDKNLLPILAETLSAYDNVQVVQGDIMELDPVRLTGAAQPESGYLVVANIPYYITSALIRHLLEAEVRPRRIVLTVQREVAERICASPGQLSLLALSVQVYGEPGIIGRIPAGAFYPAPQVDSAIVRIDITPAPRIPTTLLPAFFRLAKAGFSQKRKTLRNALAGGLGWKTGQVEALLNIAGIELQRRAETLSLDEWQHLAQVYTEQAS
jgi:16S rRNA (adenine1518-N6/adenine1519-N6)-dimethyltransferase